MIILLSIGLPINLQENVINVCLKYEKIHQTFSRAVKQIMESGCITALNVINTSPMTMYP